MSDSSSSENEEVHDVIRTKKLIKKLSEKGTEVEEEEEEEDIAKTFAELGINESLCEACDRLGWTNPSKIQVKAIPPALEGRDIIGLAETGSGKTGAFALPVLQSLLDNPQKLYCLVLTPTRELAFQIGQQFEALGAGIGLLVAIIVGGMDMVTQAIALGKRPHIIVATPGRLVDHLESTKGFTLRSLKFLIMDEADRILNMDFEAEVDKILKVIPRERKTYLFSATMTKKVAKLERASLRNPVRVEICTRYKTVDKLKQNYMFIPQKWKEAYLVYLLDELSGSTSIIFCATCQGTMEISLMLRQLGMQAVPLHGQMGQEKRLGSLNKFKSKAHNILVCTDVASRGLDIPHVDVVINYDVPPQSKDYIHRVGRTARAGRSGLAVTIVTQYDVEAYQKIEAHIGKKLEQYPTVENEVMILVERTQEALEVAKNEIKDLNRKGKKRMFGEDDDEDNPEVERKFNSNIRKGGNDRKGVVTDKRGGGSGRGGGRGRGRGGRGSRGGFKQRKMDF